MGMDIACLGRQRNEGAIAETRRESRGTRNVVLTAHRTVAEHIVIEGR